MECLIFSSISKPIISNKKIQEVVSSTLVRVKRSGDISVHLIGDYKMKRLNAVHRGKDKTTDVLSFSALEGDQVYGAESEVGDIFISVPQILRQAKQYKVSPKEEMIRMLVHGVLHLLGYDHVKEKDATHMFALQEEMVKKNL